MYATPSSTKISVRFNGIVSYEDDHIGQRRGPQNQKGECPEPPPSKLTASPPAARKSLVASYVPSTSVARDLPKQSSFKCPPMPLRLPVRQTSDTASLKDCPGPATWVSHGSFVHTWFHVIRKSRSNSILSRQNQPLAKTSLTQRWMHVLWGLVAAITQNIATLKSGDCYCTSNETAVKAYYKLRRF